MHIYFGQFAFCAKNALTWSSRMQQKDGFDLSFQGCFLASILTRNFSARLTLRLERSSQWCFLFVLPIHGILALILVLNFKETNDQFRMMYKRAIARFARDSLSTSI